MAYYNTMISRYDPLSGQCIDILRYCGFVVVSILPFACGHKGVVYLCSISFFSKYFLKWPLINFDSLSVLKERKVMTKILDSSVTIFSHVLPNVGKFHLKESAVIVHCGKNIITRRYWTHLIGC